MIWYLRFTARLADMGVNKTQLCEGVHKIDHRVHSHAAALVAVVSVDVAELARSKKIHKLVEDSGDLNPDIQRGK